MAWSTKSKSCSGLEEDFLVYDFQMTVSLFEYQVCESGLFASIDGGAVEGLTYTKNPALNTLTFDLEMHMPCDMDTSLIYDLKVMFCDEDGGVICYGFPFKFACSLDCDDRNLPRSQSPELAKSEIRIFPNPARDILMLDNQAGLDEDATKEIIDQIGRRVHSEKWTNSKTTIDLQNYNSGL